VNGIVIDLGVSSMQIDTPERGFSFKNDGPLDMRFNPAQTISAADIVNGYSEAELADLIWRYGEERESRRIARLIVQNRPSYSTGELANCPFRIRYGATRGRSIPLQGLFKRCGLRLITNWRD